MLGLAPGSGEILGLDAQINGLVMDYFLGKKQWKTVILVTYDKSEAEALGGRLLLL